MKKNRILTELPKWETGGNKGQIKWKSAVGMGLELLYEGNVYEVKVIDYTKGRLFIDYNGYIYNKGIQVGNFREGQFGAILKLITNAFKYELNKEIRDERRNIVITDKEYRIRKKNNSQENQKWYKYTCNKCGWTEGWIEEGNLLKGNGCACCAGRVVVEHINSIWATDRWMCDLGVSEDDAKKYTRGNDNKIKVRCPSCKGEKRCKIIDINKYKSIGCSCGDGKSYISKYVLNVLNQLEVEFKTEVKYYWNIYTNPLNNKISKSSIDFVIYHNNREIPLEADGSFHRKDNSMSGQTKEESERIDKQRDENCLKHLGEETIRISDEGNIRENILNSKLNEMFDLSVIDWLKCEEFALKNIVKEVCEYWNNKKEWETTQTIADNNEWGIISSNTISGYLKKGEELGWTKYCPKKEKKKGHSKAGKKNGKPVEIFKDGISLGIFESCSELARQSEELFGVKLYCGNISSVCIGVQKKHKGCFFKYI